MNWQAMLRYFATEPVSFIDFISFRWVRAMWRRRHWPRMTR
jgi:hypothetical protein